MLNASYIIHRTLPFEGFEDCVHYRGRDIDAPATNFLLFRLGLPPRVCVYCSSASEANASSASLPQQSAGVPTSSPGQARAGPDSKPGDRRRRRRYLSVAAAWMSVTPRRYFTTPTTAPRRGLVAGERTVWRPVTNQSSTVNHAGQSVRVTERRCATGRPSRMGAKPAVLNLGTRQERFESRSTSCMRN